MLIVILIDFNAGIMAPKDAHCLPHVLSDGF